MKFYPDDPRFRAAVRNNRPLHLTGSGRMGWGEYMLENFNEGFRHGIGAVYESAHQATLKPWEQRNIFERIITPVDWFLDRDEAYTMVSPETAREEYDYYTDRPVSREWLEWRKQYMGERAEMAARFQFADVGTASRILSIVPATAGYVTDPVGFLEVALTGGAMRVARSALMAQKTSRFMMAMTYPIRKVDTLVAQATQNRFIRGGAQALFTSSIASLPELAVNLELDKEMAWKSYMAQNAMAVTLGGAFGRFLKGPASSAADDVYINSTVNAASAASKAQSHLGDREDLVKAVMRAEDDVAWHRRGGPEHVEQWKRRAAEMDAQHAELNQSKELTPEEYALSVDEARQEYRSLRVSKSSVNRRRQLARKNDYIGMAALDERMEAVRDTNPQMFEEYLAAADETGHPFMPQEQRDKVLGSVDKPTVPGRIPMDDDQALFTSMGEMFRDNYLIQMRKADMKVNRPDLVKYIRDMLEDRGWKNVTERQVETLLHDLNTGKGYRGPVYRDKAWPTLEQAEETLSRKLKELDQLDHTLRSEHDKLIVRTKEELSNFSRTSEARSLEVEQDIRRVLPKRLDGELEWPETGPGDVRLAQLARFRFNNNRTMYEVMMSEEGFRTLSDPERTTAGKLSWLESRFPDEIAKKIDFRRYLDIFQRSAGDLEIRGREAADPAVRQLHSETLAARLMDDAVREAKTDLFREQFQRKFSSWVARGYEYVRSQLDGSFGKTTRGETVAFNLEAVIKERRYSALATAYAIIRKHNMLEMWGDVNLTRDIWMAKDNMGYIATIQDQGIREFVTEFVDYLHFFDEQFIRITNSLGGNIEQRADYVFRQGHQSLNSKNVDEWVRDVLDNYLDRDALLQSHPYLFRNPDTTEQSIIGFLRESAESILHNRMDSSKMDPDVMGGSLTSRHSTGRQIPIKRDMRMEYEAQWGSQNPAAAILDHISNRAENMGLMEVLGPDYKALEAAIRGDGNMNAWQKYRLKSMVRQLTGELNTPENVTLARVANAIKQLTNLRLLGLNGISQLYTDSTTTRNTINYIGFRNAGAIGNYYRWQLNMHQLPENHPSRIRADAAGVSADVYANMLSHLGLEQVDMGPGGFFGAVDWAHRGFFTITGMQRINEAGRRGAYDLFERAYSNAARWLRDGSFPEDGSFRANDLSPDGKRLNDQMLYALKRYGITEDMLREVPFDETGRIDFLNISDIQVRRKFNQMFQDLLSMSIMTPRASDKFWSNLGLKSGTVMGSAARILGQYNSFLAAVFNQQYRKFIYGYSDAAHGRLAMYQWLGLSLAAGVMAQVTKDAAKLRGPEDGNPLHYLRPNNLLQAMEAGGAFPGLFMAIRGRGLDRLPIGDGFDPAIDLVKAGFGDTPFQSILHTLMKNAPGANLPFMTDVDNLIINKFFTESYSAMIRAQVLSNERETGRVSLLRP